MRTVEIAVALGVLVVLGACGPSDPARDHADRMAQEHAGDRPEPSGAVVDPSQPVKVNDVAYGSFGDLQFRGYLARPVEEPGPLPGLIVIHEWWGLNDNIRAMTRRLAGEAPPRGAA